MNSDKALSTEADRNLVSRMNGFYVGQLDADERASFERCIADGYARRIYEGSSGLMGLSKIEVLK